MFPYVSNQTPIPTLETKPCCFLSTIISLGWFTLPVIWLKYLHEFTNLGIKSFWDTHQPYISGFRWCRPVRPIFEQFATSTRHLWRFHHSCLVPGLVNIQKTSENCHRNSGFSHEKWWCSTAMLVYQRVNYFWMIGVCVCFLLAVHDRFWSFLAMRSLQFHAVALYIGNLSSFAVPQPRLNGCV